MGGRGREEAAPRPPTPQPGPEPTGPGSQHAPGRGLGRGCEPREAEVLAGPRGRSIALRLRHVSSPRETRPAESGGGGAVGQDPIEACAQLHWASAET